MDFEMRFLSIFYAIVAGVTATALVGVLLLFDLAPLMLIITPMFLAMWALWAGVHEPRTH